MNLLLGDDYPILGALMAQHFRHQGHGVADPVTDPCTALTNRRWSGCDACLVGLGVTPLPELSASLREGGGGSSPAVVVLLRGGTSTVLEEAKQMPVNAVGTEDDDFESIHSLVKEAVRRSCSGTTRVALSAGARAAVENGGTKGLLLSITPRERQILQLLAAGKDTAAMAASLGVRVTTVRTHMASLMRKLDAHTRLEAMAIARRLRLLDPLRSIDGPRSAPHVSLVDTGRGSDR